LAWSQARCSLKSGNCRSGEVYYLAAVGKRGLRRVNQILPQTAKMRLTQIKRAR
jgi:hypothetical protein